MSDENSLEVARFFDWLARNWFIRKSLYFAAFGGIFGTILMLGMIVELSDFDVGTLAVCVPLFFVWGLCVFLAGIQYIVNRMHRQILGHDFNYLCSPREFDGREA
jgi:hypothetical protein